MPLASDGKGNWLALGQDGQWVPAQRAKNPETGAELLFDGTEWKPLPDTSPKPEQGVGDYLRGAKRAIEGGLTFGFRDEAAATIDGAVNSAVTGAANLFRGQAPNFGETYSRTYDKSLGRERAETAEFAERNPGTAIAGNIVGGVIVPGGMGSGLVRGTGAGSAALRGTVAGSTGGALAGFGDGEGGLVERGVNAAQGGALGAVGGAALGVGANIAGRIGGRVLDIAGRRNPEVAADRQILRAIARDRMSIDEVAAAAAKPQGGAPLALADLAGRNTTQLAVTAANVPGEAAQVADRFTQARRAAGPDRMARITDDVFGGGGGTRVADETAILAAQKRAAGPLYDEADAVVLPASPRLQQFISDPDVRKGIEEGLGSVRRDALADGLPFRAEDYGVTYTDDGLQMVSDGMPTRLFDAAKRGLDGMIETARGAGNRSRARELGRLRDAMVSEVDSLNPAYARARAAYAGPAQAQDAMETGRGALRLDRDELAGEVARQSPANMDFMRIGTGRAVTDMASDPKKVRDTASKLLEDRQMQARLQSLLPPDKQAALAEALQGELRAQAGNAAYSPRAGSPTSRNQASMDDMEIDPPGGMLMGVLENYQNNGAKGVMAQALRATTRRVQGINSSTADALAKRLFEADPMRNAAIIKALTERQGKDALTAAQRGALAERLMQGLGVAGGMQVTD